MLRRFRRAAFRFPSVFAKPKHRRPNCQTLRPLEALEDRTVPSCVVTIALGANAQEGITNGSFVLTRTGDISQSASVTVGLSGAGTATPGQDFQYITGNVTFQPNSATATVPVNVIGQPYDNAIYEPDETVILNIMSGGGSLTIGSPSSATVTITDNDGPPAVTVAYLNDTIEGGTPGAFRFTRTGSTSQPMTVTYTVDGSATPGSDYTALSGSVTIPSGWSYADVAVAPIDDSIAEYDETVDVTIQSGTGYAVGTPDSATVIIRDNEQPVVMVEKIDDAAEGSQIGWFAFSRMGDTGQPLTVNYTVGGTATPGDDYLALSGSVTFDAGATVADTGVAALSDGVYDPDETVTVTIQSGPGYTVDTEDNATVTIADIPIVTIEKINDAAEGGATGLFLVSRTGGDVTQPLTVYYDVSGSAMPSVDYEPLPGIITIPAGDSSAAIEVNPLEDELVEGSETITIALGINLESQDYAIADDNTTNQATANIGDNDVGLVLIESDQATEVEEDDSDTYDVFLSVAPIDAVTVTVTPGTPLLVASELQPTPSPSLTLTFTPSDWDVPQLITVSTPDNGIVDGDRLVSIDHALSSADLGYDGLTSNLVAQVKDKPQPDPKLTAAYWKDQATKRIDIGTQGATDLDKGFLRNIRINAAYAELFQSHETSFYWMGAAAYASSKVGVAIADAKKWDFLPPAVTNGQALANGNKAVYDDLYWQHLAFAHGGIALMRQFKQQNQINQAQLDPWEKIADGLTNHNDATVWEGNVLLLKYEQQTILQPYFNQLVGKGLLNYMMDSPIPGGKSFNDYHFKTETGAIDLSKLFNQRLVTNYDARWAWVENAVLPDWKRFLPQNLNIVRPFMKNLQKTDGSYFPRQP